MSWAFCCGSKDRVVDEAMKVGPTNSLIFECCLAFFLLPGVSGCSSWNIRGILNRAFGASGLSLSFYRPPEVMKKAGFLSLADVQHGSVVDVKLSSSGS